MAGTIQLIRDALRGKELNFTSGSIDRAIVLLSVPMVLEMAGESLFAVVDAFFVAKISPEAIAAVGFTETVLTLIYAIAIGISTAATAVVARRIGEGNKESAAVAGYQVILIGVSVGVMLGLVGWLYAGDVLQFMGAGDVTIETGTRYAQLMFGFNIVIVMLFLLNAIFRGAGNAIIAMQSLWIANIINILLDPCLIFGYGPFPEMGLEGAAWATVIGRGVGVLFQVGTLFFGVGVIRILKRHLILRWDIIKKLVLISLGGTGQYLIASASWIFLMRIIADFGPEVVAGYVIAIRLLIFTILPSWGMSNAAATLVGQNLGAGQPGRAEKSVWRTAFFNMLFLTSVSFIYFIMAPELIGIFTGDAEVLKAGIAGLRIISAGYIFFAYGMVISQAFNGAGDTFTPTVLNFVCFWLLEIPLAYFLAHTFDLGFHGVYFAIAFSESFLAVVCIWYFRKGYWKKMKV